MQGWHESGWGAGDIHSSVCQPLHHHAGECNTDLRLNHRNFWITVCQTLQNNSEQFGLETSWESDTDQTYLLSLQTLTHSWVSWWRFIHYSAAYLCSPSLSPSLPPSLSLCLCLPAPLLPLLWDFPHVLARLCMDHTHSCSPVWSFWELKETSIIVQSNVFNMQWIYSNSLKTVQAYGSQWTMAVYEFGHVCLTMW